jgi:hypothetical protein
LNIDAVAMFGMIMAASIATSRCWPRPLCSRATSANVMPSAASMLEW